MAFTAAIGTQLKLEDTPGAGTYTVVGQVGNVDGPGMKGEKIDTSTHDLINGGYKTFITGLKDGGVVKFPLFHDPDLAMHARILANFEGGQPENWRIAPPWASAKGWQFDGVVLDLGHKYELKGATMQDVTIEISGRPVLGVFA